MTSEEDKMNILVQLFWICIAVLESDYEHEFILGLRHIHSFIHLFTFSIFILFIYEFISSFITSSLYFSFMNRCYLRQQLAEEQKIIVGRGKE